jgi:3-dehydroquinate synthase
MYIGNTHLECEIENLDIIKIKSYNKIYNVHYTNDTNDTLEKLLSSIIKNNDFIFVDKNIYNFHTNAFHNKQYYVFEAIEEHKTMDYVLQIVDKLIDIKFTKKNKLIVIGGGITQDVGGFAATIFKRGIDWIFIPTTLLSMTDSAIGGKVCINRNSKNILSLFNAPSNVYISDCFLQTLNDDDIISGLGEALKLSLIGGEHFYNDFIENYKKNNYLQMIKISMCVKKIIIEYDELEKYERKVLNYGHTFGHALESITNYFIPHGIAVLIGMYIINVLFYEDKYENVNKFILELIPKKFLKKEIHFDSFIEHVLNDKKNDGDKICFILLEEFGNTKIVYHKLDEIICNEKLEKRLKNIVRNLFEKTI